jgi:hypothetical protein
VKKLPPAVGRVTIPEYFSPSQIAYGEECLLRIVLGSTWTAPRLNSHPSAQLGRIFHRLLERAVRGEMERRGELHDDLSHALSKILEEARSELASDPTAAAYADLSVIMPPLVWRRKVRTVIDIAAELYRLSSYKKSTGSGNTSGEFSFENLPDSGEWAEVMIKMPSLRLKGRIDIVQKSGGITTLRDLKSGRVEDRDGQVLSHIERQLRTYGAMASEVHPDATIRLVVDAGTEYEIPFDGDIANETKGWIVDVVGQLPKGEQAEPMSLARVGEWCGRCPHRHVCPAYRAQTPALWNTGTTFRLPFDIWGNVEGMMDQGALIDLTLRDAAGRLVKVCGIRSSLVQGLSAGERLWLFGLRAQVRGNAGGSWMHPLNFHEVPADGGRERAWSLEAFAE